MDYREREGDSGVDQRALATAAKIGAAWSERERALPRGMVLIRSWRDSRSRSTTRKYTWTIHHLCKYHSIYIMIISSSSLE